MDSLGLAGLFVVVAAAVYLGTGALLPLLRDRAILDHPNERSSHETPTPKGGGIAVIGVILAAWVGAGIYHGDNPFFTWIIPATALMLAMLSWIDDLRGLPPILRLVAQIVAVASLLLLRPEPSLIFQGLLPGVLDALMAGILWVWFINLFNFMDGIDGITVVEVFVIGIGIALVGDFTSTVLGVAVAGGAVGFLKWNWHPAKVFMGDVGSVPLGFLLGWLLLDLAGNGHWAAALILPAYYLADATITLIRRGLKGEKIWQAHRQHYYQQAVQRGVSHGKASGYVFIVGMILVALAYASENGWSAAALVGTIALSLGFLRFLATGAGK